MSYGYGRGLAGDGPTSVFDPEWQEGDKPTTTNPSVFNTDRQNTIIRENSGRGKKNVKDIQDRLRSVPLDPGPIDGIWGPKTCGAMINFQRKFWGDAKGGYLDSETFQKLGFDPIIAGELEKDYGLVCGGSYPTDGSAKAVVGPDDIKHIQIMLQVPQTGVWDRATCEKLYGMQAKVGNYGKTLLASTFIQLGAPRPVAMLYAASFADSCGPYWTNLAPKKPGGGGTTPQPEKKKPGGNDIVITEKEIDDFNKREKAGMSPWVFVGMGAAILVAGLWYRSRKGKR